MLRRSPENLAGTLIPFHTASIIIEHPQLPPPINNDFANGPDVKIHTCTIDSKQLGQGRNPWEVHKQIACGVVLAKALHH